jgi:hypothetical protein
MARLHRHPFTPSPLHPFILQDPPPSSEYNSSEALMFWTILLWLGVAFGSIVGLYSLHRLCLKLEAEGLLNYWHKKPSTSAFRCFGPLQEALQPEIQHVFHINEERPRQDDADAQGDPKEPGLKDENVKM